jgi:hypothetical protein
MGIFEQLQPDRERLIGGTALDEYFDRGHRESWDKLGLLYKSFLRVTNTEPLQEFFRNMFLNLSVLSLHTSLWENGQLYDHVDFIRF